MFELRIYGQFAGILASIGCVMVGNAFLATLVAIHIADIGVSARSSGVVVASYSVGILIGSVYIHNLVALVGHIRAFAILASIFSAASLGHLFSESVFVFVGLRVLVGIAICGLMLCTESWLTEQSAVEVRGRVMLAYTIAIFLAFGASQLIFFLKLEGWGVNYGLAAIILSISLVPVALTRTEQPTLPSPQRLSLRELFALSPVGMICAAVSGLTWTTYYGLLPFLAARAGMAKSDIGLILSATVFGTVLFQIPLMAFADRIDRRLVLAALSIMGAASAIALSFVSFQSPYPILIPSAFFGAAVGSIYAVAVAHTSERVPTEQTVAAIGALLLIYGLAATAGPYFATYFIDLLSYQGFFLYFTFFLLLAAAACIWRWRFARPVDAEDLSEYQLVSSFAPGLGELSPYVSDDQLNFDFSDERETPELASESA